MTQDTITLIVAIVALIQYWIFPWLRVVAAWTEGQG